MKADRIRLYIDMYYEHELPSILEREFKTDLTKIINEIKIEMGEILNEDAIPNTTKVKILNAIDTIVNK